MFCDKLHIICGNCGALFTIGNKNNEKAINLSFEYFCRDFLASRIEIKKFNSINQRSLF